MKKIKLTLLSLLLVSGAIAQRNNVGIGTITPDSSAQLDVTSANRGFLPPRLTTTQRGTITSPATGLVIFNSTTGSLEVNTGTPLVPVWTSAGAGNLTNMNLTSPTSPAGAYAGQMVYNSNLSSGLPVGPVYWNGTRWVPVGSNSNTTEAFTNGTPPVAPYLSGSSGVVYTDTASGSPTLGQQFIWNGNSFVSYSNANATAFYNQNTTNDAGSAKGTTIYRPGALGLGATTVPHASAQLDVNSTSKGLLPPRMTKAQMDAIASPAVGLMVYCLDCSPKGLYVNNSSPTPGWTSTSSGGSALTLDCTNQSRVGTAIALTPVTSGDTIMLPYSYNSFGGGSATIAAISSTGVTGLTASNIPNPVSITAGTGVLKFNITGTPSAVGTASFLLNLLGASCTLTYPATLNAVVSGIDCANATLNKYLISGASASGRTITIAYTGGNGGNYPAQAVASTGVTGVTASIATGVLNTGNGTLVYTLSGTPSGTGTATFNFNIGGQNCSFATSVYSGNNITITNASEPAINYNIKVAAANFWLYPSNGNTTNNTQLALSSSTSNTNTYWNFVNTGTGQYAVYHPVSGRVVENQGGSTASYNAVTIYQTNTSAVQNTNQRYLLNTVSGSAFNGGTISIRPSDNTSQCWDVYGGNFVSNNNIQLYPYNGNVAQVYQLQPVSALKSGVAVGANFYATIGYFNGNGGTYPGMSIASTGVTGLTATLAAGSFTNGPMGFLQFTISGTPASQGVATFPVFIGGQSFSFSLNVCPAPSNLATSFSNGNVVALGGNTVITATATNASSFSWNATVLSGTYTGTTIGTGASATLTSSNAWAALKVDYTATNQCGTVSAAATRTDTVYFMGTGTGTSAADYGTSCNRIKTLFPASADGIYWVDPDTFRSAYSPMQVYCDMTTDGGGWTLLAVNGASNYSSSSSSTVLSPNTGGWLPRTTVIGLANVASTVQLRAGNSSTSYAHKTTSSNSLAIAALQNSSTDAGGAGTWHNGATWTVDSGTWCWTNSGSIATGWPLAYHSSNYANCVHWWVNNGINRTAFGDPWASTWIR